MPGVMRGKEKKRKDDLQSNLPGEMSSQRRHYPKSHNGSEHHITYTDPATDPTYVLEHLATFSVGAQYGISTPEDGLRRLLQMEKASGIWTQRMQMRLERKSIVIIDHENGDVVERFPISLISEPTSYTSDDPHELYNNIIVFVVRDDPSNRNPPEMHIFQCARVSAQEVVNEMKMFISGKWKASSKEGHQMPPPPTNPPPEPPINGVSVREQVNLFNAVAAAAASPPKGEHGILRMAGSPDDCERESNGETSSTSSELYERDVAILNHCFDDIERFIARLQHAAAAFKELERRQKARKNKKKDMGDGILSIRAKPPSEKEFIDILQKFKLSFNLLAKLKSHIHEPNAPELVHFLFTPLALIIDAARDSNYSTSLSERVVSPLLTKDAVDLLLNCCTSKESDLWHSLGSGWLTPKRQWEGFEDSYHPVFSDGWAPENPFAGECSKPRSDCRGEEAFEEPLHPRHPQATPIDAYRDGCYEDHKKRPMSPALSAEMVHAAFEGRNGTTSPVSDTEMMADVRSDFSVDSMDEPLLQFESHQKHYLQDLLSKGGRVVQVMYPRTANNDKELTVLRGEYLEVIDDSRKWWKVKNSHGQVAHVPHTIVGRMSEEETLHGAAPRPKQSPHLQGEPAAPKEASPRGAPAIQPADWVRRERQGKKDDPELNEAKQVPASIQDRLHEELKQRVNLATNRKVLAVPFVTSQSSSEDVQFWLSAKGFGARTQQKYQNVKGAELFNLSKMAMEEALGTEEGNRLFNQITIQKNICGFTTLRSKELSTVLEARRKKIEPDDDRRDSNHDVA